MRLIIKSLLLVLLILVLGSCQKILGIDPPEEPSGDDEGTYATLDYIEVEIRLLESGTGSYDPVIGADVTASYHDTTGHVIHHSLSFDGVENTIGATGTTDSDGRVTLRLNNARLQNTTYGIGGEKHQLIRDNKHVNITASQSGFADIARSSSFPVNNVETGPYPDGSGNTIRYYSVEASKTHYMASE